DQSSILSTHIGCSQLSEVPVSGDPTPSQRHTGSVSAFMMRSLIHLDLSFVPGEKHESLCLLLRVDIQLDQHHELKMLFSIVYHCIIYPNSGAHRLDLDSEDESLSLRCG
ncbi:hypothetical protein STEG23_011313, partial [Scotinomys teguina]